MKKRALDETKATTGGRCDGDDEEREQGGLSASPCSRDAFSSPLPFPSHLCATVDISAAAPVARHEHVPASEGAF